MAKNWRRRLWMAPCDDIVVVFCFMIKVVAFVAECNFDMNNITLSLMILMGVMVNQALSDVSMSYCPKVIEPRPNLAVKYFNWDEVPENGKIINQF